MSQTEKYGTRDLAYSAWHRTGSISRFLDSRKDALELSQIDLDVVLYVEYRDQGRIPLLLIEVALDVGQDSKPTTVTGALARLAGLPALCVLYKHAEGKNPVDNTVQDIASFRYQWVVPRCGGYLWNEMTPRQYAEFLLRIRNNNKEKSIYSYVEALKKVCYEIPKEPFVETPDLFAGQMKIYP